jgi:hypothetical protein
VRTSTANIVARYIMRKLEPAQQEQLSQIPQTQFVTQAAEHDLKHNVGGKLQMVKRMPVSSLNLRQQVSQRSSSEPKSVVPFRFEISRDWQ